jgi:sugar phosphate isomerase/epimerase
VRETVGLVPAALRAQRLDEAKKLSEFAGELEIKNFALHVGFVPEDPDNPIYPAIVRAVRNLADECRFNGQQLCLETGQESADALLRFIADLKTSNVKVNFDPANMILYGSGEPVEALGKLAEFVVTVHCKDGKWPAEPGKLGVEMPLGQGDVGMDRFVSKLRQIGFQGPLVIEREISGEQQIADVRMGIELLKRLLEAPPVGLPPAPAPPPPPAEPAPVPPVAETAVEPSAAPAPAGSSISEPPPAPEAPAQP